MIVRDDLGKEFKAFVYYATDIDDSARPYSWYLEHVLVGAKETQLPETYIQKLNLQTFMLDPNSQRSAKEMAIY